MGDELFDTFCVGYLRAHPPQSYTLGRLADRFADPDDPVLVEVGREVGALLEERPLGHHPVGVQVLVAPDPAVLDARGVRGKVAKRLAGEGAKVNDQYALTDAASWRSRTARGVGGRSPWANAMKRADSRPCTQQMGVPVSVR